MISGPDAVRHGITSLIRRSSPSPKLCQIDDPPVRWGPGLVIVSNRRARRYTGPPGMLIRAAEVAAGQTDLDEAQVTGRAAPTRE